MRRADRPRRSRATKYICAKHAQMLGSQGFTFLFHGNLSQLYANARIRPNKAVTPKQTCPRSAESAHHVENMRARSLSFPLTHQNSPDALQALHNGVSWLGSRHLLHTRALHTTHLELHAAHNGPRTARPVKHAATRTLAEHSLMPPNFSTLPSWPSDAAFLAPEVETGSDAVASCFESAAATSASAEKAALQSTHCSAHKCSRACISLSNLSRSSLPMPPASSSSSSSSSSAPTKPRSPATCARALACWGPRASSRLVLFTSLSSWSSNICVCHIQITRTEGIRNGSGGIARHFSTVPVCFSALDLCQEESRRQTSRLFPGNNRGYSTTKDSVPDEGGQAPV